MILVILLYLVGLLFGAAYSLGAMALGWLPLPYEVLRVPLMCGATACTGGCLYCLRAIYINKCVFKRWDKDWVIWYFIRPITSIVAGATSYLFLKAGLLVLESSSKSNASEIGFFALAFIAGLNVDRFIDKIEDVAKAVWGIEKTRTSQASTKLESKKID